jgi:CubicO group peptidase (beta-lactamase class C family)
MLGNSFLGAIVLVGLLGGHTSQSVAQSVYFPPLNGSAWATVSPASLGWDTTKIDSVDKFLVAKNTKAFIVLDHGKIAIEHYFGSFTVDSLWYWASASKSLTAFLVGVAQENGLLSLSDTTSRFLGKGWTSCPPEKEHLITIRHQLTMTTGVDDGVPDSYCTDPSCLVYLSDAGTRWAYHNAPYSLLDSVVKAASGQSYNVFTAQRVRNRIGMTGIWAQDGENTIYFSNARSMARFGLLVMNRGIWNTDTLMHDTSYFRQMTTTSQDLNHSYGYLWWLNGKDSYRAPQTQILFPGPLAPDAPSTMISALGKNGQILDIVAQSGLVLLRMGDAPDSSTEVPWLFNNDIWKVFAPVLSGTTGVASGQSGRPSSLTLLQNFPNPFNPATTIRYSLGVVAALSGSEGPSSGEVNLSIYDLLGRKLATLVDEVKKPGSYSVTWNASRLPSGAYFCRLTAGSMTAVRKMVLIK